MGKDGSGRGMVNDLLLAGRTPPIRFADSLCKTQISMEPASSEGLSAWSDRELLCYWLYGWSGAKRERLLGRREEIGHGGTESRSVAEAISNWKFQISNGCKTIVGDGAEAVELPQRTKTLRGWGCASGGALRRLEFPDLTVWAKLCRAYGAEWVSVKKKRAIQNFGFQVSARTKIGGRKSRHDAGATRDEGRQL